MKQYFYLLIFFVSVSYVRAQAPAVKPPGYPSPNAASFGKYGDIPVSYHTGVPDISTNPINLYGIR